FGPGSDSGWSFRTAFKSARPIHDTKTFMDAPPTGPAENRKGRAGGQDPGAAAALRSRWKRELVRLRRGFLIRSMAGSPAPVSGVTSPLPALRAGAVLSPEKRGRAARIQQPTRRALDARGRSG